MKPIEGFNNKYFITESGEVYSQQGSVPFKNRWGQIVARRTELRKMNPAIHNGYLRVLLVIKKKRHYKSVHRLVAQTFIPNPENKPQVNHINGIKTDNRVENLEWCTISENILHSFRTGLNKADKGLDDSCSMPLVMVDTMGNPIKFYGSLCEANRDGLSRTQVTRACMGKRDTYRGYKFSFV